MEGKKNITIEIKGENEWKQLIIKIKIKLK